MEKIRLALLGCGYLNEIVATALEQGSLPEYELIAVMGRNADRTSAFASKHSCKACTNINELLAEKPDFTAEAASINAIQSYGKAILNGGSNLVVLSIGAFADSEFYEDIKLAATKSNRRVYIASGAVGGFDILRTASLMGCTTACISAQKSPASLANTPLYTEALANITGKLRVFNGTVKEAIGILPTKVNVAVATALASAGPISTTMNIDAVEGFNGDEYKIEIHGSEVNAEINIYSRTSAIAAISTVAVLQNAVSPIVF